MWGMKDEKKIFLRYWPVTMVIVAIFLSNLLLVSFVTVQAFNPDSNNTVQENPPESPVPQETLIIPNTGQGQQAVSIFISIFSSWFFWVTTGMVLLFFLFLLIARSSGKNHQGE